jgi:DedD protein
MSDADAQLLLKKRARRRLVGAIAFVLFAAVVLPMVMDASPPLPTQEVQIRIPGQEQPIYTPPTPAAKSAPAPAPAVAETSATAPAAAPTTPPATPAASAKPAPAAVAAVVAAPVVAAAVAAASDKTASKAPESKAADKKPADKPADKPVAADKHGDKPAEKATDKAKPEVKKDDKKDAKKGEGDRAAAILAGKPAAAAGAQVILIGAYANPGNVKVLRAKLDQIGVKTYTETLNSPQGNKTRLRAGPFANKDAAEKALDKMKRIGVSGVISAK